MIKAFNEFWKSYFEVCEISGRWMREHWVGYTIVCIIGVAMSYGIIFIPGMIKEKIEEKRNKKENARVKKETDGE